MFLRIGFFKIILISYQYEFADVIISTVSSTLASALSKSVQIQSFNFLNFPSCFLWKVVMKFILSII